MRHPQAKHQFKSTASIADWERERGRRRELLSLSGGEEGAGGVGRGRGGCGMIICSLAYAQRDPLPWARSLPDLAVDLIIFCGT